MLQPAFVRLKTLFSFVIDLDRLVARVATTYGVILES